MLTGLLCCPFISLSSQNNIIHTKQEKTRLKSVFDINFFDEEQRIHPKTKTKLNKFNQIFRFFNYIFKPIYHSILQPKTKTKSNPFKFWTPRLYTPRNLYVQHLEHEEHTPTPTFPHSPKPHFLPQFQKNSSHFS